MSALMRMRVAVAAPMRRAFTTAVNSANTTDAEATTASPAAVPSAVASSPPAASPAPRRPFLFMSAPLEDVSESAFRRLMIRGGADLTFSEMARADNLARKSTGRTGSSWWKTEHSLPRSGPCVVQLLVGNETSLQQTLNAFEPNIDNFAGFNLNQGCPSPQILALGLGAQAIKRISKTQRYVEALNEFIERRCTGPEWTARALPKPTVSVKLRLGANEREKRLGSHINLIRALNGNPAPKRPGEAEQVVTVTDAASGPVSHFILHGRHGKQHYETPCDFNAIAHAISASGASNIVANGDIHTLEQVLQCLDMGAAGVMIGRAAVKDPFIFSRLKLALLEARPETLLLKRPTSELDAQQLRDAYHTYTLEYRTLGKYTENVSARIGQSFDPNPRVELNERARVELQGRKHPDYDAAVARDRNRPRRRPDHKEFVDYRISMEQQMQDSVQG